MCTTEIYVGPRTCHRSSVRSIEPLHAPEAISRRRILKMQHILSRFLRTSLCGLIVLLLAASASAQFRAGIQGSVTDPAGAVVPGATVTLVSNETSKTQQTTTSDSGFYRFSNLAPGSYSLTAEAAGFKKQVIESMTINAENVEGVDIRLETGGVN